jgi:uncharacterized protein YegP (UPF0339 family)
MLDNAGEVLLRSEGYPTTGARDNGLASVQKNRGIKERYSTVEDNDEYFVVLKAGNHKEIARSCPHESAAALFAIFPFLGTNAIAKMGFRGRLLELPELPLSHPSLWRQRKKLNLITKQMINLNQKESVPELLEQLLSPPLL